MSRSSLPIAGASPRARVRLPLAPSVRSCDAVRPEYAVWEITLRCDLACRHCGSRAGRARPDELDTEEALDLVTQMAALGVEEATIIGGEAYLRDDWHLIAAALVHAGIRCTMTTGGRGLTAERVELAKRAGIESVSVSIDGLAEAHDHQRALTGSHDAALRALDHLRAAGIPRSVNTQLNGYNLREIEPLLEQLTTREIHSWQVQITVAMGRAADHPELLLQPWQMLELMPLVARLAHRCEQLGIRLWPGSNIGYFGPYEQLLRWDHQDLHQTGCEAGTRTLGIEANGDIKGCPSLPSNEYVGGNVREHSLREIWERADALRFNRERQVDELWGRCATCYYARDCKAGCTWTGHVLFGRRGNNPYCHHRALELLREGRRERLELHTPAPGEPFDHAVYRLIEEPWPPELLARAREVAERGVGWIS
ncbi:radical SAM/SPASM domain-containing protein [Enhygromyxa salina]|uniref:Antilisterial bacteriocin subtilosin biosynthesis protein AlbA n=1 Tax=Enhygromyxa salina TaxID=215803 RepID=A0A2S9XKX8_9BACT|nr:radical SAM protein [Enhygromyxa salina]PRP93536.1 Antilisterial bacteriocin subtilosin biosynthesis protein AlbA [Enhygromyxa salina]